MPPSNNLGKLLNVSPVSVYIRSVREDAEMLSFLEIKYSMKAIAIDEMWLCSQKKKYWILNPCLAVQGEAYPGLQAVVMLKPYGDFIKNLSPLSRVFVYQ